MQQKLIGKKNIVNMVIVCKKNKTELNLIKIYYVILVINLLIYLYCLYQKWYFNKLLLMRLKLFDDI